MPPAQKLFDTLFREKPALILLALKDVHDRDMLKEEGYASQLAKTVDCTYSHAVKVLKIFQEHGLIREEKNGRQKVLHLTEKGMAIADCLHQIRSLMNK